MFRGRVELASTPFQETQPDREDQIRTVWVFALRVVGSDARYEVPSVLLTEKQKLVELIVKRLSDKDIYTRAVHSRRHPVNRKVTTTTYERNACVAELAKRRANGTCQLCDQSAPFANRQGEAYLESHHIAWLWEGGEDTVENTVALCPNCHKKMHILNTRGDRNKLVSHEDPTCTELVGGNLHPCKVPSRNLLDMRSKMTKWTHLRLVEQRLPGVQECWKLYGAGSIGGQALVGIPHVYRLRRHRDLAHVSRVWPFETGFTRTPIPNHGPSILHAEIWPGVVARRVQAIMSAEPGIIRDQAQVRAMALWAEDHDRHGTLGGFFGKPAGLDEDRVREEGWVLGAV